MGIFFYGVGDTVTTLGGLTVTGVAEAGPIVGPAMDHHGVFGYLSVKIGSILVFALCWSQLEQPNRTAIPLALLVVGSIVTIWNTMVVIVALH